MEKKVLIATLYRSDGVIAAVTKFGADKLVLLVDKPMQPAQKQSLELLKKMYKNIIEIETKVTETYDIVKMTEECINIIDEQPKDYDIYIDISAARKTKAIGLLFASFSRHDQVKKISYFPEESDLPTVFLPKFKFRLTEKQRLVLDKVAQNHFININQLSDYVAEKTKEPPSKAMVYHIVSELREMDFIEQDKLELTDAGRIARL